MVKNQRALQDFQNNEIERCKISVWEVILGAPARVDIPYLMHGTN